MPNIFNLDISLRIVVFRGCGKASINIFLLVRYS